jgi:glycyl-tRNA synthetase beta subunit
MNIEDFLNKYNFDYLIVAYNDAIRTTMQDNPKYFILYDDSNLKYTLFARNDLIDAKTRNEIIESYDKAVKEAKEKEASKKKS